MFEMQVRCVWVILSKQVRFNFSTNCKFRSTYLSFSDHQIPSKSCPKVQEMPFQRLQISKFPGDHAPGPPRNLAPLALDFRAFGARKLVTKIPTSTPGSLDPIPPGIEGYSIPYLQESQCLGQAILYVSSLQANLSMEKQVNKRMKTNQFLAVVVQECDSLLLTLFCIIYIIYTL